MIVGVTNEERSKVEKKVREVGMEYPIALTSGTSADEAYGVKAVPRSFLLDREGRVVWSGHPSDIPLEELEALL